MRIIIKGGVWKNTEDEILKAAVMKYGKNQWARISSLLVRKSAKQCKARWYEWLDPSIRKVEWSREEEEKLLHLAKLMPTQWRTIAQAMSGRTAAQCMEHYEKLLNAAQQKDGDDMGDDPRRLRPGEIDPNPETKPARPDPIDMDEDEKEMLQEARARLANTKGKKAKRKTREKQLEEARRLAALQKRRELKAAGITIRHHTRKRKGVDYNAEVPFERRVPAGFFDVEHEDALASKQRQAFEGANLQDMDEQADKRRMREEMEARKRDAEKQRLRKKFDVPSAVLQVNKLNDPAHVIKRSKLSLPAPQMSDGELEEVVKMQQAGSLPAHALQNMPGNTPTHTLLSGMGTPNPQATPLRTPIRTPAGKQDALMNEARDLAALANSSTPLKGDMNTPLHTLGQSSQGLKGINVTTPNPLATPSSSVRGGMTPGSTPVRDSMGINPQGRGEMGRGVREALRSRLAQLPAPQFEYDAELPPDDAQQRLMMEDVEDAGEVDAEDVAKAREAARKRREAELLKLRSTALQKNLPRPRVVNRQQQPGVSNPTDLQRADELIKKEVLDLLMSDAYHHPTPNGPKSLRAVHLPTVPQQELDAARELIVNELVDLEDQLNDHASFAKAWESTWGEFVFVPSQKRHVRAATVSRADKLASLQQEFQIVREHMVKDTKLAVKLEKKLGIMTGGYQGISAKAHTAIDQLHADHDKALLERACFTALYDQEAVSVQRRKQELEERVAELREREANLQKRYANLQADLQALDQQPQPPQP